MNKGTKKLILEYSYLELENEEVKEICENVESELRESLKNSYPQEFDIMYGPQNPPEEIIKSAKDPEVIKHNPDVKNIYRHLASKFHPDIKNTGDEKIFRQASEAYEENNIAVLLKLAAENNIKISTIHNDTILLIKTNVETLRQDIITKKESVAWRWAQADNQQEREEVLEHLAAYIRENK